MPSVYLNSMVVLSVSNVNKSFGAEELFSSVTFSVNDTDRMAIVGANGTGKTTLLKMIIGQENITPSLSDGTKGAIFFAKGIKFGYLSQDVIESLDNTLKEEALLVFKDLIKMEKDLEALTIRYAEDPSNDSLAKQYGKMQSDFEAKGGYDYHYKVNMMLSKFGFSDDVIDRPIRTFSGGERTKMAFVKLLLLEPEILILDEPTNHLDVSTIDWLENYLKTYHGAILFVSHDRYFINGIATKVAELEQNNITIYKGNFDSYIAQKKERYEVMLKEWTLQQKEIDKLKRFIEFYKPKPRFVSRAKDREKKLQHMKIINKPTSVDKQIKFSFKGDVRDDRKIIYFENTKIGFDTTLIEPFSFYLFGNDKLAIMGDNGTGKTTLLRTIIENKALLDGHIRRLMPLNIGYIQQNDFDFQENQQLIEYFMEEFPLMGEKNIRNHLGKFAFTNDDVFKEVSVLSGGEKMRALLAKIVLKNYDVLLLDEPTNHLDLLTREALIKAMQDYEGAIIFVSHDRYFIDTVANKILYISNTKPYYHEGNYQSFKEAEKTIIEHGEVIKEKKTKTEKAKKVKKPTEADLLKIEKELAIIKEEEFKEENYMDSSKMKALEERKKILEEEYDLLFEQIYAEE